MTKSHNSQDEVSKRYEYLTLNVFPAVLTEMGSLSEPAALCCDHSRWLHFPAVPFQLGLWESAGVVNTCPHTYTVGAYFLSHFPSPLPIISTALLLPLKKTAPVFPGSVLSSGVGQGLITV